MSDKALPTVVGVFDDRTQADRAVHELKKAGFGSDEIGYIVKKADGHEVEESQKKFGGEGLAAGAVIGGIAGAAASLLIPGVGPVLAAGTLLSVLGGAAVGAASGGILGALAGLGIPENDASFYEGEFQAGRIIVTVKADGKSDMARDVIMSYGGYDAERRAYEATQR
jgi:hypothetical protein